MRHSLVPSHDGTCWAGEASLLWPRRKFSGIGMLPGRSSIFRLFSGTLVLARRKGFTAHYPPWPHSCVGGWRDFAVYFLLLQILGTKYCFIVTGIWVFVFVFNIQDHCFFGNIISLKSSHYGLNCVASNLYIDVLTTNTSDCDLIWRQGLYKFS